MNAQSEPGNSSEAEFDQYAADYDQMLAAGIEWSGESAEYYHRYKIRDVARVCETLASQRDGCVDVLDFGAGTGNAIPYWREIWPRARLTCADVSRQSLALGEKRHAGQARFIFLEGERLPFPDHSFDVAFAACVFHHIPHEEHVRTLTELRRVVTPGGAMMVYEHNPFNPLTQRVVRDCPFDRDAHLVGASTMRARMRAAGFQQVAVRYRVYFPHAARALRGMEHFLSWLPFGAQYFAVGVVPKFVT